MRRDAGSLLLRFESADDLVQGIMASAVASGDELEWRGDAAFNGWIRTIAARHLSNRRDYWFAMKRNPGAVLRLTQGGSRGEGWPGVADPSTGPRTFAQRREQLTLVTRAMALLLPRDREIIQWSGEGASVADIAQRLGISEDAAERARSRALDRLRKAFVLVANSGRAV